MVCRISGARIAGSIAGWAQANISPSRLSGTSLRLDAAASDLLGDQQQMLLRVDDRSGAAAAGRRRAAAPPSAARPPGLSRNAARRPAFERGGEGVGQRILGAGHVAGAGGKQGDQPAVALPGGRFRRRPRALRAAGMACAYISIGQIGRTSIVPCWRPGSAPPRRSPRRGPAPRSCSSRRAAPWCRHRGRRARGSCRRACAPSWRRWSAAAVRRRASTPAFFIASV